jgi:hypothetical protein
MEKEIKVDYIQDGCDIITNMNLTRTGKKRKEEGDKEKEEEEERKK